MDTLTSTSSRIAFVQAGWHRELTDRCREAFLTELAALMPEAVVEHVTVPGALEIPLRAQLLVQTGCYDAIVASALVVDGGIYRHEFVAETVVRALMQVQLETNTPVFSVVLTPHHFHEHETHAAFFRAHLVRKGEEAARACAATMASLGRIPATV